MSKSCLVLNRARQDETDLYHLVIEQHKCGIPTDFENFQKIRGIQAVFDNYQKIRGI